MLRSYSTLEGREWADPIRIQGLGPQLIGITIAAIISITGMIWTAVILSADPPTCVASVHVPPPSLYAQIFHFPFYFLLFIYFYLVAEKREMKGKYGVVYFWMSK